MPLLSPVPVEQLPQSSNFLQSAYWGIFKSRFGWQAHAFRYREGPFLLLERKLPGGFSLLYAPHPFEDSDSETGKDWNTLVTELRDRFGGRKICIRFDLPWNAESGDPSQVLETLGVHGLHKAVMDIQPPSTVIVPLAASEEEQLKAMKSKTRYNIRLAARKGVVTREEDEQFVDSWYELYRETAERDRISIHSREYYRQIFETADHLSKSPDMESGFHIDQKGKKSEDNGEPNSVKTARPPGLRIISARHEGDLLASIIVALYGRRATYLYGASSNRKRNLMASYAVQQAAMNLARREGCTSYDLFGIPPADDPEHPMHGLYRFKTGFGGRIIHRAGAWDLPLSRLGYPVYRRIESLRYYYFKKLKKR